MSRAHLLLLAALLLPACTSAGTQDSGTETAAAATDGQAATATLVRPSGIELVPGEGGEALAVATSQALYDEAPVVVLAPAGDLPAQGRAASVSVALGAPLLLTPEGSTAAATSSASSATGEELARLGGEAVVAVGDAAARWASDLDDVDVVRAPDDPAALTALTDGRLGPAKAAAPDALLRTVAGLAADGATPLLDVAGPAATASSSAPAAEDDAALPELAPPARLTDAVVLASQGSPDALAAVATARAAGASVHVLDVPDPRSSAEVVTALSTRPSSAVLALGNAFGDPAALQANVEVAQSGTTLPGGGQLVLPGKLYVALYGHPGSDALGVLGEQGVEATIARAKELAASYEQAGSTVPVVPTLEIITTVASSALGDGDYSAESTIDHVQPLVDAAADAGVYVVLDLQPGYDDFLTQAKQYESLLALPHVGLALDPEWRLRPGERHMRQIGRVGADEVNSVVAWLADLTRERRLPQKMLLLHQFKTYMLEERTRIEVDRPEVTVVTQMDGHGPTSTKLETWNILRPGSPEGMRWGWKNFYDEDSPTLTPAQTLAVEPTPVFVSYQ